MGAEFGKSLFGTIADNHRNSTFGLNGTRVRFIFRSSISFECSTAYGIFSVSDNQIPFTKITYRKLKMKSNFKAKHFNFRGVKKEEMQRRNEIQLQSMTVGIVKYLYNKILYFRHFVRGCSSDCKI